jgi:REP element-mobilizing transposase RayT
MQIVFEHIRQKAKSKGIFLDCVNGYTDHIHCLVSFSNDQTISKVLQHIKGESSFWINKEKLCREKFEWQDEYFAVSVSHSHLKKVRDYIHDQENHHQKKTFQQE